MTQLSSADGCQKLGTALAHADRSSQELDRLAAGMPQSRPPLVSLAIASARPRWQQRFSEAAVCVTGSKHFNLTIVVVASSSQQQTAQSRVLVPGSCISAFLLKTTKVQYTVWCLAPTLALSPASSRYRERAFLRLWCPTSSKRYCKSSLRVFLVRLGRSALESWVVTF
jgi:hypothetical protein